MSSLGPGKCGFVAVRVWLHVCACMRVGVCVCVCPSVCIPVVLYGCHCRCTHHLHHYEQLPRACPIKACSPNQRVSDQGSQPLPTAIPTRFACHFAIFANSFQTCGAGSGCGHRKKGDQLTEAAVDEMIVALAKANFCLFHGLVPADVATERVESSSLGVVGWATETVMDWEDVGKDETSDKMEHAKPNTQNTAPGWESLIHIF